MFFQAKMLILKTNKQKHPAYGEHSFFGSEHYEG